MTEFARVHIPGTPFSAAERKDVWDLLRLRKAGVSEAVVAMVQDGVAYGLARRSSDGKLVYLEVDPQPDFGTLRQFVPNPAVDPEFYPATAARHALRERWNQFLEQNLPRMMGAAA